MSLPLCLQTYFYEVNTVHKSYHPLVDAVHILQAQVTLFFERPMKKISTIQKRGSFRHGDLRNALVTAGLGMARAGGPQAVVLREATRQAGVSPNAAYRHFANQAQLLGAVRSACFSELAKAIEKEMSACRPGRNPQAYARKSLRAVGMGYLGFAMREPGMFRTAFSEPPPVESTDPANTASLGLNPFQLLSLALDRMHQSGLMGSKDRKDAEYLAWSTVHGLALLVLDGPLRPLPPEAVMGLGERLVMMVERGLS
jgi:AcrR family transcriptional regulator